MSSPAWRTPIPCRSTPAGARHAAGHRRAGLIALTGDASPNRPGGAGVSMTGTQVGIVNRVGPRPRRISFEVRTIGSGTARRWLRVGGSRLHRAPSCGSAGTRRSPPWAGGDRTPRPWPWRRLMGAEGLQSYTDWGRGSAPMPRQVAGAADGDVSCTRCWSWPASGGRSPSPRRGRSPPTTACRWWCAPAGGRPHGNPPDQRIAATDSAVGVWTGQAGGMGLNSRITRAGGRPHLRGADRPGVAGPACSKALSKRRSERRFDRSRHPLRRHQ